jgi:hypothetical protein
MDARDAIERKDSYLRMMERIPTQGYLGAALGSIALSALLRLFGKKDAAVFVGQWPPTFILFALAHKLLQPSTEWRPQPIHPQAYATFDGAQGDREPLGDLAMGEARKIGQLDRLQLFGRQALERSAHSLTVKGPDHLSWDVALARCVEVLIKWADGDMRATPQDVNRSVTHDREQPGAQRSPARVIGVTRAPDRQENFLEYLFRVCHVTEHPIGDRQSRAAIGVIQLF